ncbi:caspase domain-containing protein [Rhodocollybia butyracea]|uniref:Caspase domain-containing protein n=1 Tax=Rhodocollybia butyracea TaxID=206335 RepID=A0A9P5P8I3_9AGAR|nr:caspase domain-containing protein [Rhodocollybia butyracea]
MISPHPKQDYGPLNILDLLRDVFIRPPKKKATLKDGRQMPHEDVRKMKALLIDTYRYHPNDMITLFGSDDPKQPWPTMLKIVSNLLRFYYSSPSIQHTGMKNLVADARSGNCFFFDYAGHFVQKDNLDGSEESGNDDACLFPCDSDGEKNIIIDEDLWDILVDQIPQGSQLVAILDSYYSGSQLDLEHDTPSELLHASDLNWSGSYLVASTEVSPGATINVENSAHPQVNVKRDPKLQDLSNSGSSVDAEDLGDTNKMSSSIQLPDESLDPGHGSFETLSIQFDVCCMQDYCSDDPAYLSICQGEILQVVGKDPRMRWWRAVRQTGGVPGWIPQSHVQPLNDFSNISSTPDENGNVSKVEIASFSSKKRDLAAEPYAVRREKAARIAKTNAGEKGSGTSLMSLLRMNYVTIGMGWKR